MVYKVKSTSAGQDSCAGTGQAKKSDCILFKGKDKSGGVVRAQVAHHKNKGERFQMTLGSQLRTKHPTNSPLIFFQFGRGFRMGDLGLGGKSLCL